MPPLDVLNGGLRRKNVVTPVRVTRSVKAIAESAAIMSDVRAINGIMSDVRRAINVIMSDVRAIDVIMRGAETDVSMSDVVMIEANAFTGAVKMVVDHAECRKTIHAGTH